MTLRTLLDRFDLLMDTPESVPKLRRFILQLAVRGRLSDRRASDEPAETLVERMEAEKERLDAAGEYKYQKTMPPIEEDDIPFSFSVPEGWTWVRLGNLGKVYGGGTPKKSNSAYWGGEIPWVSPKDMNGAVIQSTEDQITQKGLEESSAKLVPPGSLLIVGRSGILERKLPVGVTAVECTANQDLKVLTPFVSGMARYIRLMLKGFEPYILDELVKTGTTVRSLKYTEFQLQPYPLPPLEEQQRIVETVDRLMDECDALEQQQERERALQVQVSTATTEALQSAEETDDLRPAWERVREHFDTVTATTEGVDALRQTILQLAVQGRLTKRDPDDTPADVLLEQIQQEKQRLYDAGEIRKPKTAPPIEEEDSLPDLPAGWVWTRFAHLVINRDADRVPISKKNRAERQGKYPYYGASGIIDNIDDYTHEGTNLLIGEDGANLLLRSKPVAFLAKGKYWVNNHAHVLGATDLTILKYVRTFINATDLTPYVTGTAQAKLTQTRLNSIPVAVPPLREQQRIVETVDSLLPLCDDLEDLLSETDEHGEQLLEAALRDASTDRPDAVPAGATA